MGEIWQAKESMLPWRTGRKVGRTIYIRLGREASDDDVLIGVMDSPEIASDVCLAHNHLLAERAINGQSHRTGTRATDQRQEDGRDGGS